MKASTYVLQFLSVIGVLMGLVLMMATLGLPESHPITLLIQAACIGTCVIVFFVQGSIRRGL